MFTSMTGMMSRQVHLECWIGRHCIHLQLSARAQEDCTKASYGCAPTSRGTIEINRCEHPGRRITCLPRRCPPVSSSISKSLPQWYLGSLMASSSYFHCHAFDFSIRNWAKTLNRHGNIRTASYSCILRSWQALARRLWLEKLSLRFTQTHLSGTISPTLLSPRRWRLFYRLQFGVPMDSWWDLAIPRVNEMLTNFSTDLSSGDLCD